MAKNRDYHNHTNYNDHADRDMSIKNIIKRAEDIGLVEIALTEHVREHSPWIGRFLNDTRKVKSEVNIIPGFEAKVLNDYGELDIKEHLAKRYLIIGSFHTFKPIGKFYKAFLNLTKNTYVDIIGHFGLCNDNVIQLNKEQLDEIIFSIKDNNKVVEINSRYKLPTKKVITKLIKNKVRLCYGSDSHKISEVGVVKWTP